MNVHDAIRTKRAVRRFEPATMSAVDIEAIVDAGRRAQSAMNKQPWQFIVVTEREMLEKLAEVSGHAGHLRTAAMGLFLLVHPSHWATFDGGQCAAYLQLAAWERGYASCLGSFVEPEVAREMLGWPDEYELLIAISFGRPPVDVAERPPKKGGRRPLGDVLHTERW